MTKLLTDSQAFKDALAAKANKAGDTFTGGINRDPQFYLDLSGLNPRINFDAGDHLDYDRAGNALSLSFGDQAPAVTFGGSGDVSSKSWTSKANSNFKLGTQANGNNYVTFDGQFTRIEFVNQSPFAYVFYIGNNAVMSIDGSGNLKVRGTVQGGQTSIP